MTNPLAPWRPTAGDPFDLRKVGHLLRRAGFAAPLGVRKRLVRGGLDAALAFVAPRTAAVAPADERLEDVVAFGKIERLRAFRAWLLLESAHPLRERLSYFWHGHFATSNQKVQDPRAMAHQLATFDRLGVGRFDELVRAICRDPAMLRWLDNDVNTKRQPNENFARELFELFTLGRGHYTEVDIREAARAFSGWHVRDGRFRLLGHLHDGGSKTVFGTTGKLGGDDIVRLCVERAESARFLARKWLRFFVHPDPEPGEVEALATVYRREGRDVGATLLTLFRSRLFFSAPAYRSKIKSPAEFVIGTVRLLGGRGKPAHLARVMGSLGEVLCEPPSVEGWHGERAWLSPASWLLRSNFVADLLAGRRGGLSVDPRKLFGRLERPEHRVRAATNMLLDGEIDAAARGRLVELASAQSGSDHRAACELLHAVACLPEFQLC
ncbi:MAG: DUF1800 domain-containing protein [bacterium]|nr:DUF1800 domain-containing protein [bacterium]